jgi:hypothetical protein
MKGVQMPEERPDQEKRTKSESVQPKATRRRVTKAEPKRGGKPWTFPKNTLEEAIRVPKAIEEKNAGNPMHANDLAKAVGFRQPSDWRYLDLVRSASQYGLVSGTGKSATTRLEKLGQDVVAPGSSNERQQALLGAFRNVPEFKSVEEFYGGKKIPEDEFFFNTLTRNFNVPKDRVQRFAEIFVSNLEFLKSFDVLTPTSTIASEAGTPPPEISEKASKTKTVSKDPRVREFLDTCFVMMPFGDWFDKYYQEIYVPAIKDAGLEPIRADELFSTGSVVEQVWDQIVKAKLLLADLSGKNPNVFYELGLAHAARKPVVFTSAVLEDVPFDLRHLRVIIYEVKEPEWAVNLRRSVTDYLKNALKEPEKSIPHPFRPDDDYDKH